MNDYYAIAPSGIDLYHHGILGQKWGKQNGPPYPLGSGDHSSSENKAGWKKSLNPNHKVRNAVGNAAKKAGKATLRKASSLGKKGADVAKKYVNEKTRDVRNQMKTREAIRRNAKQKEYAIKNEIYRQKLDSKINKKYGIKKPINKEQTVDTSKIKERAKKVAKTAIMLNPTVSPLVKLAIYEKSLKKTTATQRHNMSDSELNYRVGRARQENELRRLERENVDTGRAIIGDVGKRALTIIGTGAVLYGAQYLGGKVGGKNGGEKSTFNAKEFGQFMARGGPEKKKK